MRSADKQVAGRDAAVLRYAFLNRIGNAPGHADKVTDDDANPILAVIQHQRLRMNFVMNVCCLPLSKASAKGNIQPGGQVGSCGACAKLA